MAANFNSVKTEHPADSGMSVGSFAKAASPHLNSSPSFRIVSPPVLLRLFVAFGVLSLGLVISSFVQAQGVVVSSQSLELDEGGAFNADKTYKILKVKLSQRPASSRTVNLQATGSNIEISLQPSTLTFNVSGKSKWNKYQKVKVIAGSDNDATNGVVINDEAAIKITGDGITEKSVDVFVQDDDEAGKLNLASTSISVTEGKTENFEVKLKQMPAYDRRVRFKISDKSSAQIEVSPEELTFSRTGSNKWNLPQIVRVTAVQDGDVTDGTATITPRFRQIIDSSYYQWTDSDEDAVQVAVTDDDSDIAVSTRKLKVNEAGFKTFAVKLGDKPKSNQVVTLASDNPDVTIDTKLDMEGNQNTLTFKNTASHWDTAQNVKVAAANDADKTNDTAMVTLTSPGLATQWVTVAVTDDDDVAVGVSVNPVSPAVTEGGSRALGIRLASQPGNDRKVKLSSSNSAITVDPSSLTFTGGTSSNWNTLQTVTVSAADDSDTADNTAVLSLKGEGIITQSVTVNVTDDDAAVPLSLTTEALTIAEGASREIKVALGATPLSNRTVKLTSSNSSLTISPASLFFTPSDSFTQRVVTITAVQDSDANDSSVTINFRGDGLASNSMTFNVLDKDVELTLSTASLTMDEDASKTFTIQLDMQPTHNREFALASDNSDVIVTPTSLAFNSFNWNTSQTVTVRSISDSDKTDDTATISLESAVGVPTDTVTVSVIDDDDADIPLALSAKSIALDEEAKGSFSVKLKEQPGKDRIVSLESSNIDVVLKTSSLGFTQDNWDVYQRVEFTVSHDNDAQNDTAKISFSGKGLINGELTVVVTDNDPAINPVLSRKELSLFAGTSADFTVKLKAKPKYSRTIKLTSSRTTVTLNRASLIFTPSNWDAPQTVTVDTVWEKGGSDYRSSIYLKGEAVSSMSLWVSVVFNIDIYIDPGGIGSAGNGQKHYRDFTAKLASQPGDSMAVALVLNDGEPLNEGAACPAAMQTGESENIPARATFATPLPPNLTLHRTVSRPIAGIGLVASHHDKTRGNKKNIKSLGITGLG